LELFASWPLSRTAGEGAERSEAGEGLPTRTDETPECRNET